MQYYQYIFITSCKQLDLTCIGDVQWALYTPVCQCGYTEHLMFASAQQKRVFSKFEGMVVRYAQHCLNRFKGQTPPAGHHALSNSPLLAAISLG